MYWLLNVQSLDAKKYSGQLQNNTLDFLIIWNEIYELLQVWQHYIIQWSQDFVETDSPFHYSVPLPELELFTVNMIEEAGNYLKLFPL